MSGLRDRLQSTGERPLIVAHRGVWGPAPENSLAAVAAAARFDQVEIDVRISADGTPYLMHDPTLARMTGIDLPLDAVRDVDLSATRLREGAGGPDAPTTEQHVPTLGEALAAGDTVLFDLDVKRAQDLEPVAAYVTDHPARNRCMLKHDVTGQDDIAGLRALERRFGVTVIAKVMLRSEDDLHLLRAAQAAEVAAAEVWFASLALLSRAARTGLPLTTYTLDDVHCAGLNDARAISDPAAVWGVLCEAGIRAIMTDRPDELAVFLRRF